MTNQVSPSRLVIDVHGLRDFTEHESDIFMLKIVPLLERVANSTQFREKVLWYNYVYTVYYGSWYWRKKVTKVSTGFKNNNGDSNKEIYDKFMSGVDEFNTVSDKDIDLFLTMYYSPRITVGYTYPSTFKTWVNSRFFKIWLKSKAGHCNIVGNVIHEYMHNMGYNHASRSNSTRKHTVPYAFGRIATEVARMEL